MSEYENFAHIYDRIQNGETLDKPLLVDFWAEWCGPCKMLEPVIDRLADKYQDKINVAKLDADMYPEIMQQYGIMSIPTVLVFKGKEPIARYTGFKPDQFYESKLDKILSEN